MSSSLQIAIEHHKQGRIEEAKAEYKLLLSEQAENHHACYLLGSIYFSEQAYQEAEQYLEIAIQGQPPIIAAYSCLGHCYLNEQKFEDACKTLTEAIQIQPSYLEAWQGLSQAFVKTDRPKEAIMAAEYALKIDGSDSFNLFLLGQALEASGDSTAALKHYTEASLLSPDEADSLFHIGRIYLQQDQYDSAIDSLNKMLTLHWQGLRGKR